MISEQDHAAAVEAAFREGFGDGRYSDGHLEDEAWEHSDTRRQLTEATRPADPSEPVVMVERSVAIDCEAFIVAVIKWREALKDLGRWSDVEDVPGLNDLLDRLERARPLVPDSIREVEG